MPDGLKITGRWWCESSDGSSQVYPENDLIEHDIEDRSSDCICGPDVEYLENGALLVTHHSLDGREV